MRTVDHFLDKADFVLGIGTSFTRSTYTIDVPPGKESLLWVANSATLIAPVAR